MERRLYRIDEEGNRRDDFADDLAGVPGRPVLWVLGDSSPFGMGVAEDRVFAALLRRALHDDGVGVKNLAVAGYNSLQVRTLLADRLRTAAEPPAVVVLWVGFNDTTQFIHDIFWRTPFYETMWQTSYRKNVTEMLALCAGRGIGVILVTVPCLQPHWQLERMNDWIRAQAGTSPRLVVVDVQREFAAHRDEELYASFDKVLPYRFHPSERGHALVSQLLLPVVKELLAKR